MSRSIVPAFNLKSSSKILFRFFSFSLLAQSHFQVCMALFFYHLRCSLQQQKRKHYSCLLAWNNGLFWSAAVDRFYQGRSCKVAILIRARAKISYPQSEYLKNWSGDPIFLMQKVCNRKSGMYVRNSKKEKSWVEILSFWKSTLRSIFYHLFCSSFLAKKKIFRTKKHGAPT